MIISCISGALVFFSSLWAYPVGKKFQSEKNYWKGDLIEYSKFYAYTKKIASTLLIAAKQNFNLKSMRDFNARYIVIMKCKLNVI